MYMKIFGILFLVSLFLVNSMTVSSLARPVSYPGGITGMVMNNGDVNSVHLHYSPTAQYSVGYKGEYWREGDYMLNAVQVNTLLKRWNKKESQANLYLKSGVGAATSFSGPEDGESDPALFTGMAADWENRRFFVSYSNRYTEAGDIDRSFRQSGRVGVAPYIGEYGDLHTWLMVEVRHSPKAQERVTVRPLVRLFKGVNLMEAGISNQGDVLFNWVIRY